MSEHPHTVSFRVYLSVFVGLIFLTLVTYNAAYMDFGSHAMNVLVAVGIAVTKASLVVLYFMHVKYSKRLIQIVVASGFVWLGLLIVGTLHDYTTRGWLGH
jgi:cytochrome c oxidase subunit IV